MLKRARRRKPIPTPIEALEPRRLLAVINGTENADTIQIFENDVNYVVTVNGNTTNYPLISHEIHGLGGADSITITSTEEATALEVFGGNDADNITVGGGSVLGLIHGHVIIDGGAGVDSVVVNDSNSVLTDGYRIAPSLTGSGTDVIFNFEGGDHFPIRLDHDVQTLVLRASGESNDIDVLDSFVMELSIIQVQSGAGIDFCTYRRAGGTAMMDFIGGSETDVFEFDVLTAGNNTVDVQGNSMSIDGTAAASWSSAQFVRLHVRGVSADTWNILSVGGGVELSIDAGDAADTYNIGNGDIDANIAGALHILDSGTSGANRSVFQDTAGATNDTYTVGPGVFSKTGLANSILFTNGGDEITLNANGGANAIGVSPATSSKITINAGGGNDTITYGSSTGDIEGPPTTLAGGAGTDSIIFEDFDSIDSSATDKDYVIAGGLLDYVEDGSLPSQYAYTAENVTLNAGAYDSTFVIDAPTESTLTINAGDGNDDVPFIPIATGSAITFNGQAGIDRLDIDDTGDAGNDAYALTKTRFTKTGVGSIGFGTIETLGLALHTATNTIDVDGVNAGVAASVTGGNGIDTFNVGNGDIDSNISGTLTLVGEQGGDRIVFDDTADTGNDTYNFSNGSFFKSNTPAEVISHSFIEHLEFNANPGNNTFNVTAFGFPLDATLRGFAGADTFNLTPSSRTLMTIEASDPTVPPGDVLSFTNAGSAGSTVLIPNGAVNGTYDFSIAQDVTFFGIETFPTPLPAPGSTPDLVAADDSGSSKGDNLTNKIEVTFTGTAPANATVFMLGGGAVLGTGVADARGAYSVPSVFKGGDGAYGVTAAVQAQQGGLLGNPSTPLPVTIDTTAPPTPALAPDLSTATDTGLSFTDNVTRNNTPQFDGTIPADHIARLFFVGGALIGSDTTTPTGSWSIIAPALGDGAKQVALRVEDLAGNLSGFSPALAVVVDTVAPAAPSAAPDMTAATDTGISNSDNITRNDNPIFTGARSDDVAVHLVQGNVIFGQELAIGPTTYSITSLSLSDGSHSFAAIFEDLAGNKSSAGPGLGVTIDTVRPALAAPAEFQFLTEHNLTFSFSEDVGPTLSTADLALFDLTHSTTVSTVSIALDYVANTARFTFPGFVGAILPDANYRPRMTGDNLSDVAGNPFVGSQFDFFVLAGDANRDRKVDVGDLGILATNWQKSGMTFSQADFNHDGTVNVGDLGILATNWQKSLAAPGAPVASAMTSRRLRESAMRSPLPLTQTTAVTNRRSLLEDVGLVGI